MKEENKRKWRLMNTEGAVSPKELHGEYNINEAVIFPRGEGDVFSAELVDANTGEIVYTATSSRTVIDDYLALRDILEDNDRIVFDEQVSRKSGRTFYRMRPVL